MKLSYYFSDETVAFCQPMKLKDGDYIILRMQTAKDDAVSVFLKHEEERIPMKEAEIRGDLRFYEAMIPAPGEDYRYCFEILEQKAPEVKAAAEKAAAEPVAPVRSARTTVVMDTKADTAEGAVPADKTGNLMITFETAVTQDTHMPDVWILNKRGMNLDVDTSYDFVIRPDFIIPDWIQGAVMYQIYVDRFCCGDPTITVKDREYLYLNKQPVKQVTDWNKLPENLDVGCFYGGDLPGVWSKLDYLQDLGVEVIYLNPVFVSPSNHKYDSQDYDYVDPHLTRIVKDNDQVLPVDATDNTDAECYRTRVTDPANLEASNAYFAEFVAEVHRRGMKVILDGVFNHCGSFHRWLDREGIYEPTAKKVADKGAWHSKKSKYRGYFDFHEDGNYESWWNMETLPKLNYEDSPELQEDILRIGAKWVSPPYCVDGWRLDVAADLGHSEEFNHKFWQKFRQVVKKANPQAVILAEHYGDVTPWLQGGEWDTVMNYDAFMDPVGWFLTGMNKHSDSYRADLDGNAEAFWGAMTANMKPFSNGSLLAAMNELDNHDHSRFITRTNRICGRIATAGTAAASQGIRYGNLRQAVVMQMTWPGAPTLYYGDETGVFGWTDPDNRRTYPWGSEDWHLVEFYKYMIRIHKDHSALRHGSLVKLLSDSRIIGYGRFDETEKLLMVVNTDSITRQVKIDPGVMGVEADSTWIRIMETGENGYNVGAWPVKMSGHTLTLTLPPVSSMVLLQKR